MHLNIGKTAWRPGLRPGPRWGAYSTPQTPSWWGEGWLPKPPPKNATPAFAALGLSNTTKAVPPITKSCVRHCHRPIKSSSPSKNESSSSSEVRSESGVLSDSLSTDVQDQTLPSLVHRLDEQLRGEK